MSNVFSAMILKCTAVIFLSQLPHTHNYNTHAHHTCIHPHRHVSRTILNEFSQPEIGANQSVEERELWDNLEVIKEKASSCVGLCISLGKKLEEGGYKEIREEFVPPVEKALPRVQPRVVTGYATLLWFTSKVNNICTHVM